MIPARRAEALFRHVTRGSRLRALAGKGQSRTLVDARRVYAHAGKAAGIPNKHLAEAASVSPATIREWGRSLPEHPGDVERAAAATLHLPLAAYSSEALLRELLERER